MKKDNNIEKIFNLLPPISFERRGNIVKNPRKTLDEEITIRNHIISSNRNNDQVPADHILKNLTPISSKGVSVNVGKARDSETISGHIRFV